MWKIIFFFEDIFRCLYRITWKLFHLSLYKHPENIVPKNTMYCYKPNGKNGYREQIIDGEKILFPYWGVDYCRFHKKPFRTDLCMLVGTDCSMDSCKDCGINDLDISDY